LDLLHFIYIHIFRDYSQYSPMVIPTLYSSPLHNHWNSQSSLVVLWQRISQSHCKIRSQMKSSCHSLISFLQFLHLKIPNTPSSRLLSTIVVYSLLLCFYYSVLSNISYTHFARTSRETPSSFVKNMFIGPSFYC
jgi:hypothetical protein